MQRSKLRVLFLASCCFALVNAQLEEANFLVNSSADFRETELLIEAVTSSSLPTDHAVTVAVPSNSTEAGALSENSANSLVSSNSPTFSTNNNSHSTLESINLEANSSLSSSLNISDQLDQENEHVKTSNLRTPVTGGFEFYCITDTLFVVDSTNSVAKIFGQQKEYIAKVAELLNISTQGNHVSLLVYNLPFMGGVTSTGVALDHAFLEITNTRRANDTAVNVVIVTDGFSYDPVDVQCQNLRQLPNVRTFAVAVGDMRSQQELLIMAGKPENFFQGPDSYVDLVERLTTCEPDTISSNSLDKASSTSQLPQDDVSHNSVTGNVKGSSGQATQIKPSSIKHSKDTDTNNNVDNLQQPDDQGYSQVEEQCPTDVVFVFDASGSLQERYVRQLEMATTLFEVLPPLPTLGHIAVIKFSGRGRSRVILPLSNPLTKEEIKEVILEMPFFGGTTFTNEALVKAVGELQNSTTPGDKKQVVVVFTDGFSFEDVTPGSKKLNDNGVTVLAVAFNEQFPVNRDELETLTWHRSENVFMESNYKELKQKLRQLTKC